MRPERLGSSSCEEQKIIFFGILKKYIFEIHLKVDYNMFKLLCTFTFYKNKYKMYICAVPTSGLKESLQKD